MKLHIGGHQTKTGWTLLNVQDGPGVDIVGTCTDLSMLPDASVEEVYASHVLEHLGYRDELPKALAEIHRVLQPGSLFGISVPDAAVLSVLIADPTATGDERFQAMTMLFGGQSDPFDFHKVGFTEEILGSFLKVAGFSRAKRVERFNLFDDASSLIFAGRPISLNLVAKK